MMLANGFTSKNDHIFGINGCEATPMPRVQIEEPVSEYFYTFQIDDIPGFEHNKAEGTVKLPMGELLKGWYYHEAAVFDLVDAGVVEWFFFPNPVSLFTHANWGTAENLMTVMKDGTIDLARKQDLQRMEREKKAKKAAGEDDEPYVWENADKDRRNKVNNHALLTKAQLQFADLSFDQKQTDEVIASPKPVPDFVPIQNKLKDALVDVDFPLSPGDHEDLKVATNCLHGESPEYNEEYLIIELEKERVYHKGQTLFPLKTWTNVAGRSWWKIDEDMGTLDLYFQGFQMGYLDAKQPVKTLKYFQSPPHMEKDNRVNEDAPPLPNPKLQPGCDLANDIREMKEDTHMFWEPVGEVCPPEQLEKFKKTILDADFNTLVVNKNDVMKGMKLIKVATDNVMCGNNYLRSYIKYSHGYDFLEAGAFIHYLLEFYPPFTVPFLTHEDLNQFKVDYIYGKEQPAAEELNETVVMVDSDSSSYIVNGFALTGFGVMFYGAYAHYFGRKLSGDHTQLEMA